MSMNERLLELNRDVKNNATNSEIARHAEECNNRLPVWTTLLYCVNKKKVYKETFKSNN